ncbi:hypothetical protein CLAFUW4_12798 [Fulvia fulva]|nr:hypothetical protein CLAFUR4_12802 [Fulvia fulva]KAK4612496.1 hypothetical protein CLAFUR0_12808 [Fulvia fulva]WPV21315.1 hypothetical protein CLAFUW4_12798 [Fulvia fulva]
MQDPPFLFPGPQTHNDYNQHHEFQEHTPKLTPPLERRPSHNSLANNVHNLQQSLSANSIEKGAKASIVLTNQHVFTTSFLALTLNSATIAPLNHGLKEPELAPYLQDFGAEVLVISPEDLAKKTAAYTAAHNAGLRIATASVTDGKVSITLEKDHKETPSTSTTPNEPAPSDIA